MTIEIHNPELERLVKQLIRAGNFSDAEDLLRHVLRAEYEASAPSERAAPEGTGDSSQPKTLVEALSSVRGLLTDDEIDRCFSRDRSTERPVDLS